MGQAKLSLWKSFRLVSDDVACRGSLELCGESSVVLHTMCFNIQQPYSVSLHGLLRFKMWCLNSTLDLAGKKFYKLTCGKGGSSVRPILVPGFVYGDRMAMCLILFTC